MGVPIAVSVFVSGDKEEDAKALFEELCMGKGKEDGYSEWVVAYVEYDDVTDSIDLLFNNISITIPVYAIKHVIALKNALEKEEEKDE